MSVRPLLLASLLFLSPAALLAEKPATTELALEVPVDGGGMLMVTRSWRLSKYFYAGVVGGGGRIDRDFEFRETSSRPELQAETRTIIFPFIGPRLTLGFPTVALSIGFAAYYARTDLDVRWPGQPNLSGRTKGWGTGFYSPLLSLDFYNEKQDLVYGLGIGAFLGTSFKDLTASSSVATLTTDENPIDSLSFHLKLLWGDNRERRRREEDLEGL